MTNGSSKPVILLVFANDRDDRVRYLRNLPDEARRLAQALDRAQQAGLCDVEVRQNATVGDIFDLFQHPDLRNRIAVLHYGGHADSYQLLFESVAGQAAPADAVAFAATGACHMCLIKPRSMGRSSAAGPSIRPAAEQEL